jgi:hypothetical protein
MKNDHGPLIRVEAAEAALNLIPIGEQEGVIGDRRVDGLEFEIDRGP